MACKNTCKNAVFLEKNRSDIFPSFMGTPMRSRLAKCCFCNERKIEKEFKKMKWHVKKRSKNAVLLEKKKSDIFPPLGVPLCDLDLQNAAFATKGKLKKSLKK